MKNESAACHPMSSAYLQRPPQPNAFNFHTLQKYSSVKWVLGTLPLAFIYGRSICVEGRWRVIPPRTNESSWHWPTNVQRGATSSNEGANIKKMPKVSSWMCDFGLFRSASHSCKSSHRSAPIGGTSPHLPAKDFQSSSVQKALGQLSTMDRHKLLLFMGNGKHQTSWE